VKTSVLCKRKIFCRGEGNKGGKQERGEKNPTYFRAAVESFREALAC